LIQCIAQTSLEILRMQIVDEQQSAHDFIMDQMLMDLLTLGSGFAGHLQNSRQAVAVECQRGLHEFMN